LSNIEARLSKLDVEIGEMRWAAEQEAANEEMRIKAAAEEDARKIVESAEQEIMAAAKLARRELKAYAADLAVSLAKKQIRVDPSTDQGLMRNFLAVLIDHRRIKFLEPIVKQFEHELNQRLGFVEAEITSARELNEKERHTLETRMEKVTGKKLRAQYSRDESILGGAIVKVGSTIYDGSVVGQLEKIRERLSSS